MNTADTKPKASPLIIALVVTMILLVGYLIFAFFNDSENGSKHRANLQKVSGIRAMATRFPALATKAREGDEAAFDQIEKLRSDMQSKWEAIRTALTDSGNKKIAGEFNTAWNKTNEAVAALVQSREAVLFVNHVKTQFGDGQAELEQELTTIVDILLARRTAGYQVAHAQAQLWRTERIKRALSELLSGGQGPESAAEQIASDAELFGRVLNGFKNGDNTLRLTKLRASVAQASLDNIAQLFNIIDSSADELVGSAAELMIAGRSRELVLTSSPALIKQSARLTDHMRNLNSAGNSYGPQVTVYVGIFLVIGLILLGLIFYFGTRSRLKETAEANRINQDAILRLLDDIEGLGEGDLTAEVTVTEGFTGAIADAINLTIIQLRELVSRVVEAAGKVSASANETRTTVTQLTELSEHQAEEIAGASAAINEMAITIDQVSANAAESASVADRSVSIANKGAVVVQSTIAGMDNIRGQIQDTAKRIKRLGESSQEIGDIVSLINDIADQTNVLALNAAIQASMAGDAGRGFAVVADEVQRLAERSANATKQIAALVKTIQTDTNEAVSSMEQTTAEVVAGASLTEDAGIALNEIETVSTNLAELIQDISTAARHQSTTAGHISNTMNVIQDITSQTLDGTNRTARSVEELAEMAIDQRESVSGFKLPDHAISSVSDVDPFATVAEREHVSWLDDSQNDEEDKSADPEVMLDQEQHQAEPETNHVVNFTGHTHEFGQGASPQGQTSEHIKQVLEENSSAMDEIDYHSEMESADEELADLDSESTSVTTSFSANLEAELAGIDLDEFDIEPGGHAHKPS